MRRWRKPPDAPRRFAPGRAFLNILDDLEDWYLAEKVWNDVRSGKEETEPIEDIMREYGLLAD